MTTLREAAQQALEALEWSWGGEPIGTMERDAITALKAALAEPEPFNPDWDRIEPLQENLREHMAEIQRLRAALAEPVPPIGKASTDVPLTVYSVKKAEPVQEPVAWMTPGQDLHLNNGEGFRFSDWTPLYSSPQPQQTEPSQDTPPQHEYEVTANDDGTFSVGLPDGEELRIIPPQRKPMNEFDALRLVTESIGRLQSAGPVEGLIGIIRAVETAHGIT